MACGFLSEVIWPVLLICCLAGGEQAVYSQLSRRDADSAAYDARRWAFLQSKGPSRTAPLQGSTSFGPRDRSADGSGSYQTRNASRSDELAYHRTVSGDNQGYSPSSVNPLDFKPSHRAVGRVVPSGSGTDQAVWSQGSFSSPWGVSSGSVLGPVSQAGSTPTYVFPQGYGPHAFPVAANAWRTPGSLVPVQSSFAQQPFPPTEGVGPNDIASLSQVSLSQGSPGQATLQQNQAFQSSSPAWTTPAAGAVPYHTGGSQVGFRPHGFPYLYAVSLGGHGSAPAPPMGSQGGAAYSHVVGSQAGHTLPHVSSNLPHTGASAVSQTSSSQLDSGSSPGLWGPGLTYNQGAAAAMRHHGSRFPAQFLAGTTPGHGVGTPSHLPGHTASQVQPSLAYWQGVSSVPGTDLRSTHGLSIPAVPRPSGSQAVSAPTDRLPGELCFCIKDVTVLARP
ncbi:hypothetical protein GN956_G24159 [Arapaima gigas]